MYALGGGFGHAVRAGRLARELARQGTRVRVLTAEGRGAELSGVDHSEIEKPGSPEELRHRIDDEIERFGATRLVVDALCHGVLGELAGPALGIPRTLLLRLHTQPGDLSTYDAIVDLEPNLQWLPKGIPAVACGPLAPVPDPESDPLVDALLVAPDEQSARFFAKLGRRLDARGLRVTLASGGEIAHLGEEPAPAFPLVLGEVLPRVVVGGAGYNLTYEALAHGVPHIAIPRPRRFDDQLRRARAVAEVCDDPLALEARIVEIVSGQVTRARGRMRSYADLAALVLGEEPRAPESKRFSSSTMSQR